MNWKELKEEFAKLNIKDEDAICSINILPGRVPMETRKTRHGWKIF